MGELEKRVRKFIEENVYSDVNEEVVICEDEVSLHDIFEEARKEFPRVPSKHVVYDFGHAVKIQKWFLKYFGDE